MESLFVDVSIPIRPYLKKWISSNKEVEPFHLSLTKCHFSAILLEPLQKERIKVGLSEHKFLTDQIRCRMSSSVMNEKKFWLTSETPLIIDKRLKAMFDQQLVDFITMTNKQKGDIKDSIICFMEYYDLSEDEISWETLVKMYYRARYYVPPAKKERIEAIQQLEMNLFG